ncbi:MAG: FAD-dependent oxidoreductase [Pedosphaera sp.]|nr:FAD-dependent oxidoreductase [Pedosphaera sp.]
MRTEQVHTLILGAGPSGLAAGYKLARAGFQTVVLEKDKVCGGLMRSLKHGEFIMDVGRKELYNRLAKVDSFWSEILGDDYRHYPHRGGILYDGHIIDMSPTYRGFRRGMPWSLLLGCGLDFLRARAMPGRSKPRSLEEYLYRKRGRRLTQIFSQGFQEKLDGKRWADIPLPKDQANGDDADLLGTVKAMLVRAFSEKEVNTYKGIWRHPAKGTGQICESLAQGIVQAGGRIHYESRVKGMEASGGVVHTVLAEIGSETIVYKPLNVVSSIPVEFLTQFLLPSRSDAGGKRARALDPLRRTVVLVYLFLDEEPKFPHAWLQVTCPKMRSGRIANYAAFNGDMVPQGKTCLCCEIYCFGPDSLLELENAEIAKLALEECSKARLVNRAKCFDQLVLRLPGADASQNRDNWMSEARLGFLEDIKQFKNLYYVNRTETDIATLAGIEAAEAILSGDRAEFDLRVDPAQLQIRSESKAFAFR